MGTLLIIVVVIGGAWLLRKRAEVEAPIEEKLIVESPREMLLTPGIPKLETITSFPEFEFPPEEGKQILIGDPIGIGVIEMPPQPGTLPPEMEFYWTGTEWKSRLKSGFAVIEQRD